MTDDQLKQYRQLNSVQARASFLLDIGVTAKINIVDLDLVSQACVGSVLLPVTASSNEMAIQKGTAWLIEKAAAAGGGGDD